MRVRWPLLAAVLGIGALYVAYPYVTLFRLGLAIRTADAATLERLVDWPAVREGIKEDVCDLGGVSTTAQSGGSLPPFGASFINGIASNKIDQAVTPQALVAAASTTAAAPAAEPKVVAGADVHVNWAFFESPTTFLVSLQARGQAEPIKLEMDLQDGSWRVQRVWLPADLLTNGGSRT
ncbi:MAG TPA: DUF2939 domain-containing protein [Rhodopila sp.]|nr:DUF2939 domain-containing protein [Rhodopila sp.]